MAIRAVDLIIYDECSMVHSDVADTVDRSLRDIMKNNCPFGGKAIQFRLQTASPCLQPTLECSE